MTLPEKFIEKINKAIDDYDNGTVTRAAVSVTIRDAVETSAAEALEAGLAEGWANGYADAEGDQDEYELDIDLDNIDDATNDEGEKL